MDAADPGDVAGWMVQGGHVVGLEDAERVDITPYVEDHEMAHDCLRPGFEAAVRRWARIDRTVGHGSAGNSAEYAFVRWRKL